MIVNNKIVGRKMSLTDSLEEILARQRKSIIEGDIKELD